MIVVGGGETNGKLNDIQRLSLPEDSLPDIYSIRADFLNLLEYAEDSDHLASDLYITVKDRESEKTIATLHSYLALFQVRCPVLANDAF